MVAAATSGAARGLYMVAAAKHDQVAAVLRLHQSYPRGVPLEVRNGAVVVAAASSGSPDVITRISASTPGGLDVRGGAPLIAAARSGKVEMHGAVSGFARVEGVCQGWLGLDRGR